jgi:hypothetical protein
MFKEYCRIHNITMTDFLIKQINELIGSDLEANPGELPAEEKNSVDMNNFFCPFCGSQIDQKTLEIAQKHLENCENTHF